MIGKTILHYKILEKLGEGGMGIVYLADDTRLERKVAIKFLPKEIARDPDNQNRFENEAKAAAALNHPNIATIHAIEESDKSQFIVMEFIDGMELKDAIKSVKGEFPFDIDLSIRYAIQIARAINIAHSNKIIHRDIKSSNIMINRAGQLKVMDFGLAKKEHQKHVDLLKSTIGTAAYMSPEQASGADVDERTDIWSFGIVLYELLTGELPFKAEYEQALMYAIQHEDYSPAIKIRPDIPELLDNIINKCLQKDPDERFQSLKEILKEFDKLRQVTGANIDIDSFSSSTTANRLAVLPVTNISAVADDEYFADGMTEELISVLSKIKELRIIARSSVMQYKTIAKSIKGIGKELNVTTVLQGSVRKSANSLRVSIQLIETSSEELIWSNDYNKGMGDIFAIQSDIAKSVANALKLTLLEKEESRIESDRTQNAEAYQLYLKGRYFWNKRTEKDLEKSIELLEKAVQLDDRFAVAYAALADAYVIFGDYNYLLPSEAFPKALQAAQKALEIDNELAQAHCSLACVQAVFYNDFIKAEKEFKYAIKLNPAYATSYHWYAINCLIPLKRYDEAIQNINLALENDPLSLIINTTVGLVYYYAGQLDNAIRAYDTTLQYDHNFGVTHLFSSWAYAQKGIKKRAVERIDKAIKFLGSSMALNAERGCIYALCGEATEALEIYNKLMADLENENPSGYAMYSIAGLHACLFKNELAEEWLEKAAAQHTFRLIYLNTDPWFENILHFPRVQKIIKTHHLE